MKGTDREKKLGGPAGNTRAKRIAAWAAIVLLAGLYIATFVVALVYPPGAGNLFGACLMATVAVPLLAWIYIWLYGQMTGKKTIADLHLTEEDGEDMPGPGREKEEEEGTADIPSEGGHKL